VKIGWIGLGQMGLPMSSNLVAAGHEVSGYDLDTEAVARFAEAGGRAATSISDACNGATVVFSSIPDDLAFRRVALAAGGVIPSSAKGAIYVDMSTVSPDVSREVAIGARNRGIAYLRAPVSGSVGLAKAGTLTALVSGPEDAWESCGPLFDRLAAKKFHLGDSEQARYLKLVINNIIHATTVAVAESLALGRKGGLDWEQMLDAIAASAIGSPLLQYKKDPLKARDFSPASFVTTSAKDQRLFVEAAEDAGVPVDIADKVAAVFREMVDAGDGRLDFFATVLRTEKAAGLGDV
jgi:3-hydroxyisobutyrate dehydrogenase-like beta-hydroxyacid dehydrogenase